jgi:hypothetical protein
LFDVRPEIRHDLGQSDVDDIIIQDSHEAAKDDDHQDAPFMIFTLGREIFQFSSFSKIN